MKIARWVQPGPHDDVTADRGWLSPRAEASALTVSTIWFSIRSTAPGPAAARHEEAARQLRLGVDELGVSSASACRRR
jgi:hypothetical protein